MQQITEQWRQSYVLRLAPLVVVMIFGCYLFLFFNDRSQRLQAEYRDIGQRYHRMLEVQRGEEWQLRADEIRSLKVQLESKLWRASTEGLAQAQLQSWTQRTIARWGIVASQMQIDTPIQVEGLQDVWSVSLSIEGVAPNQGFLSLLKDIETYEFLTVINNLDFERKRFAMEITAYVQLL